MLLRFRNCLLLRDHQLTKDDLWVRNGIIVNPEKVFFDEKNEADVEYNCHGSIIAPGFIDVQINGAVGCDFSLPSPNFEDEVNKVARVLLSHGVTSFCPTIVTSPPNIYKQLLQRFKRTEGSSKGAGILGLHLEGPFISLEKRGAHPTQCILPIKKGISDLLHTYGSLDNACIVTLAPELENSSDVIQELVKRNIKVSLGHSTASLSQGEKAANDGATFVTHLFNAMLPFHHRDPHLVGLLASDQIPKGATMFYGIIADGIHTHGAALRIAYRTHPKGIKVENRRNRLMKLSDTLRQVYFDLSGTVTGIVLVTDACPVMGMEAGQVYHNGQQKVEVKNGAAFIQGTNTLCGSIAQLDRCVQYFHEATDCTKEQALEAASLHPAQLLNIADKKGTLEFGSDADFVIVDDKLHVHATFIAGEKVWSDSECENILTHENI